jgi:hypothetical protein
MKYVLLLIALIGCAPLIGQATNEKFSIPDSVPDPFLAELEVNREPFISIYQKNIQILPSPLPSPFFCRIESKIESKSKLAPRFRLGSLNYTNWMEGKGEFYSRYWK